MLVKIEDNIVKDSSINEFIVCGDPGCDGYGAESLAVFENVLKKKSDATFIVGDLVPIGEEQYYNIFVNLVNELAENPVYCAVGNHDVGKYEQYVGNKNYSLTFQDSLFIILDNSGRYFVKETLQFLKNSLEKGEKCNHIFIFFHIPPPNPYVENSFSETSWNQLKEVMEPYKNKIEYLFSGHVHYALDYKKDGYRIIISGGAGGQLDEINCTTVKKATYHMYCCKRVGSRWELELLDASLENSTPRSGSLTTEKLNESILSECYASFNYGLYSEIAKTNKLWGVEKLLYALSLSENKHAQTMVIANNKKKTLIDALKLALVEEKLEVEEKYKQLMTLASKEKEWVANACYYSVRIAENTHAQLLTKAIESLENGKDIEIVDYYVCESCGFLHASTSELKRCPGCGADKFKLQKI